MILHLHFLQRFSLVLFVLTSPPFGDIATTTAQELTSAFPSDQPSLGPSVAAVSSSSSNNNDTNTGSVAPSPAPIYSPSPVAAIANTTSSNISSSSDSPSLSPLLQLSTNPSSSPTEATDINPDIVNGTFADAGAYPFYVWTTGPGLCGGTLIHEDIVLTAAHCTCENFVRIELLIGGTFREGANALDSVVGAECHAHLNFDSVTFENDIMLIKLLNPSTAPLVELNFDAAIPKVNDIVTVIGYGNTRPTTDDLIDYTSSDLLEVDVNILLDARCLAVFPTLPEVKSVYYPESNVCAGTETGGRDSCQGDSGGPLLTANNVQIGIVSYGLSCGFALFPGVYTKVAAFEKWIKDGVCEMSSYKPDYCPDVPTYSPTPYPTPDPTYEPAPYPVNTGECEDYGKGGKGKGTMKCKKGMKRPKEPKTPKVMKDKKGMKMGKMGKKGYDDDYNVDPPVSLPAPGPAPFPVQPIPEPLPVRPMPFPFPVRPISVPFGLPVPAPDPFNCVGCEFVDSSCGSPAPFQCVDSGCCV